MAMNSIYHWSLFIYDTVNQQILGAVKFGVSQSDLAAIKFGVSPSMQCTINVTDVCWRRQILAKVSNSPNIIAHQNLLIYSSKEFCTEIW